MREQQSLFSYWAIRIAVINVLIFAVMHFYPGAADPLMLIPRDVVSKLRLWQPFTYMFLHGDFMHLFWNMYMLVMFGLPVEEELGPLRFVLFYMFCGIGAGIIIFLISLIPGGNTFSMATVGASGALFGVLVAFAVLFPDAVLLLFFIVPVKAKYMVIIFGGLELFFELTGTQPNISHIGHLGGILCALLFFALFGKPHRKGGIGIVEDAINDMVNENERRIEAKKEGRRKSRIYEHISAYGEIDSLSDDDYQFLKRLNIIYEQDLSLESVPPEDMNDHQFISAVRSKIKI